MSDELYLSAVFGDQIYEKNNIGLQQEFFVVGDCVGMIHVCCSTFQALSLLFPLQG